ncbi:MAG: hypothetical protein Q9223_002531 [Gallowayella weberi]
MDIWKKVEHPAPPTATDYAEKADSGDDVEMNGPNLDINGGAQEPHHANPQLEKRVITKLDFRVVPLIFFPFLTDPISGMTFQLILPNQSENSATVPTVALC